MFAKQLAGQHGAQHPENGHEDSPAAPNHHRETIHQRITIRYTEEGYVKDDEAAKLKPDELLKQLHDGTEEANEERGKRGFKPLHVAGWSEPPRYEARPHHMVWGMRLRREGQPTDSINFNTRVLGRKGFVAINLIDAVDAIESSKPAAAAILAATTYTPGARYEDFNGKTDKVAEYGLTALVLGGAGLAALKVAKVGLLAKFGAKLIARSESMIAESMIGLTPTGNG